MFAMKYGLGSNVQSITVYAIHVVEIVVLVHLVPTVADVQNMHIKKARMDIITELLHLFKEVGVLAMMDGSDRHVQCTPQIAIQHARICPHL